MTTLHASRRAVRPARRPLASMSIGLALTVVAGLVVVLDHVAGGLLADHIRASYPDGLADAALRDRGQVVVYLVVLAVVGVVCWAATMRAVARGRRWARATASTIFVLATAISLFDLLVGEYGATLLPASLGLLGMLPCVGGGVAVVQLWRRPAAG